MTARPNPRAVIAELRDWCATYAAGRVTWNVYHRGAMVLLRRAESERIRQIEAQREGAER